MIIISVLFLEVFTGKHIFGQIQKTMYRIESRTVGNTLNSEQVKDSI